MSRAIKAVPLSAVVSRTEVLFDAGVGAVVVAASAVGVARRSPSAPSRWLCTWGLILAADRLLASARGPRAPGAPLAGPAVRAALLVSRVAWTLFLLRGGTEALVDRFLAPAVTRAAQAALPSLRALTQSAPAQEAAARLGASPLVRGLDAVVAAVRGGAPRARYGISAEQVARLRAQLAAREQAAHEKASRAARDPGPFPSHPAAAQPGGGAAADPRPPAPEPAPPGPGLLRSLFGKSRASSRSEGPGGNAATPEAPAPVGPEPPAKRGGGISRLRHLACAAAPRPTAKREPTPAALAAGDGGQGARAGPWDPAGGGPWSAPPSRPPSPPPCRSFAAGGSGGRSGGATAPLPVSWVPAPLQASIQMGKSALLSALAATGGSDTVEPLRRGSLWNPSEGSPPARHRERRDPGLPVQRN